MNFWKYTFTGKFMYYAALACMSCIVAALPLYILNEIRWVQIIFSTYTTIFFGNVAYRIYQWRNYLKGRAKELRRWPNDKTRLN